ncbi:hypothetical protein Lbir_0702 [Legionella birminghamensis]|uniref:Uncharacterized protein n=1 Tax=Legionella birminghamensis TaxID=28083 RepID=A0A378I9F3_9GAMM|nr:hypothetical protein [Legionella birminghamensis]KTC74669.1 hypothetical protein Lbir_0702 [Legionella birminghamensis]STX31472.1 Uncharacterised protein [Legionella birminghamensis]
MEPITIAIICATVFGVVSGLAAFIRQLILSRDKKLNDKAQKKALNQEARELEKLRNQMVDFKRLDSHYQMLGNNKDAIQYLDQKIEEILKRKYELIERYAQITTKESAEIVAGNYSEERKELCNKLKAEIDSELAFYDSELQQLQKRRATLWDSHSELQHNLVDQEKLRNEHLDNLYQQHTSVLEKVYIRHIENTETIAKDSIDAGTQTFKSLFASPIQYLMNLFKPSTGLTAGQAQKEAAARDAVSDVEDSINDPGKDSSFKVQFKPGFRKVELT